MSTHHTPRNNRPTVGRNSNCASSDLITDHLPLATAHRRGVLLLVVLILLVMFVMMAVTYVLVASRQLSNNRALARSQSTGDPPAQQLDGAMMQLLHGSTNQHSVLYPHSLLEHMYGPYTAVGQVPSSNINNCLNGQIVEFDNASLTASDPNFSLSSSLLGVEGYLEGCVITMTSGPAKGLTSRIVRYDATNPANPIYHVLAFKGASGPVSPAENDPTKIVTFIINGRAFSGTGAGFNSSLTAPSDQLLQARNGDDPGNPKLMPGGRKEFALLPNPIAFHPLNPTEYSPTTNTPSDYDNGGQGVPFSGIGGANTDYDAPDYQHMAMSWTVMNPATGQAQTILPSFHRPDLINYWTNRVRSAVTVGLWEWNPTDPTVLSTYQNIKPESRDLLRQILLRPMGPMTITPVGGPAMSLPATAVDHPNFTGSHPSFDAINGPWDVDNDGDGVADSVWIDAGYPVQTSSNGKMYKPLFAILCVDLDGRLNVNAAGTTEQLLRFNPISGQAVPVTGPYAGSAGASQTLSLPRGEGVGPADNDILQFYISILTELAPSLTPAQKQTAAMQASGCLLEGGTINSVPYDGRYGDHTSTSNPTNAAPQAGQPGNQSLMGEVMRFQWANDLMPYSYGPTTPLFTSFGTPGDLWGRMAVGLDFRGQPLYWKPGWTNEAINCPYDINLNSGGSYQANSSQSDDNPFGAFELERMVRQFDVDSAGLPRRLWDLSGAGPLVSNPSILGLTTPQAQTLAAGLGRTLTTDSWDPPSPAVVAPEYLRTQLSQLYGRQFATNIVELLAARIQKDNPAWTPAQVNAVVNTEGRKLLSPELIAGLRMNINRPLGDGRDGNDNGVVDEVPPPGRYIGSLRTYGRPWDNGNAETATEGRNSSVNLWSWLADQSALAKAGFPPPPALDLTCGIDVNGDGKVDINDQILARQLLARHLYVLARLMIDDEALLNVKWFDKTDPAIASGNQDAVKKLAIRRIAQWAVNVVDFMDPDNIMTPFEYDTDPFKDKLGNGRTWQVDGIVDTNSDDDPMSYTGDDNQTWRGLVWGCERPELLITETMAFHDRRVKDSTYDDGKGTKRDPNNLANDQTYDQIRIPQGSAFFELYCTSNPNQPQQSGDLYVINGGQWKLNLAAMAPPDTATGMPSYPVWRLAITGPDSNQKLTDNDVVTQASKYPAQYSFDTNEPFDKNATNKSFNKNFPPSLLEPNSPVAPTQLPNSPQLERIIWFTAKTDIDPQNPSYQNPPITHQPDSHQIYYRHGGTDCLLGQGQYAVVGPREVTRIGWSKIGDPSTSSMYETPGNQPCRAKIVLDLAAGAVQLTDQKSNVGVTSSIAVTNYPDSGTIQQPLPIIVAADIAQEMTIMPTPWAANSPAAALDTLNASPSQFGIGISISEPLPGSNYYTMPTITRPNFDGEQPVTDCYAPLDEKDDGSGKHFLDQPEDSDPAHTDRPLQRNGTLATRTYENYKSVLLQRLANPLVPYNPKTNPYLTVDAMQIDLTVFNGQDDPASNTAPDPDDLSPDWANVRFGSRQRSGDRSTNLWAQVWGDLPQPPATATTADDPGMVFKRLLKYYQDGATPSSANMVGNHSLGFLNSGFGYPLASSQITVSGFNFQGQTYSNAYKGDPPQPFPWLTWNNRPYANVAELMTVPASHPGRLLHEFTTLTTNTGDSPYKMDASGTNPPMPFGHLLNFFNSSSTSGGAANLSQIFEYLQVPSPFVGTEQALNPVDFSGNWWTKVSGPSGRYGVVGEGASPPNEPVGTAGLHPPFNFVSNYRDPGKVNINTITDASVWNSIIGGDPTTSGPSFTDVIASRQGYAGTGAYTLDPSRPSIFSNPFRSAAGADMVPLTALSHSPTNASLWRSGTALSAGNAIVSGKPTDPDDASNTMPLMTNKSDFTTTLPQPAQYNDGTRNAYFTFQGLENLTSKLTTRSNVYAVWITVGYFEVTPWYDRNPATGVPNTSGPQVFDTAHPDGYQLGQEVGADSGQIQRHRSFYIIDRSIPVGFQRGYDNNDNNAVILKRFIE